MAEPPAPDDASYARLQSLLLDVGDIKTFLTELARLSTTVVTASVSESVSCGITLRYDASLLTVGSSDARAELLDETQYRLGGGPCLHSMQTGKIVAIDDTADLGAADAGRTATDNIPGADDYVDDVDHVGAVDAAGELRWPQYLAVAVESGLRCSVSLPLAVGHGEAFGAMNVYGFDRPHLFGPVQRRELELFAAQAAGTLRVAVREVKDVALLTQMEEALQSRTVIDQAFGIIMATQRCTASEAFDLLRRESRNSQSRLRDVAARLIERTTGRPPETGRGFDVS